MRENEPEIRQPATPITRGEFLLTTGIAASSVAASGLFVLDMARVLGNYEQRIRENEIRQDTVDWTNAFTPVANLAFSFMRTDRTHPHGLSLPAMTYEVTHNTYGFGIVQTAAMDEVMIERLLGNTRLEILLKVVDLVMNEVSGGKPMPLQYPFSLASCVVPFKTLKSPTDTAAETYITSYYRYLSQLVSGLTSSNSEDVGIKDPHLIEATIIDFADAAGIKGFNLQTRLPMYHIDTEDQNLAAHADYVGFTLIEKALLSRQERYQTTVAL